MIGSNEIDRPVSTLKVRRGIAEMRTVEVAQDIRFDRPLYTLAEAARYVRVPQSTYHEWARGYVRRFPDRPTVEGDPVITAMRGRRGQPVIPFIGLAESMVLAAFRQRVKNRVSLHEIRKAIRKLEHDFGIEHALASRNLYTDGASILYDYAQSDAANGHAAQLSGLTRVVDGQRVFHEVVADYLERITYGPDGFATELVLPYTDRKLLTVRPGRAGGRPVFVHGSAPLDDVVSRWRAGDRLADVARDFGVPVEDVEDAVRVAVAEAAYQEPTASTRVLSRPQPRQVFDT